MLKQYDQALVNSYISLRRPRSQSLGSFQESTTARECDDGDNGIHRYCLSLSWVNYLGSFRCCSSDQARTRNTHTNTRKRYLSLASPRRGDTSFLKGRIIIDQKCNMSSTSLRAHLFYYSCVVLSAPSSKSSFHTPSTWCSCLGARETPPAAGRYRACI